MSAPKSSQLTLNYRAGQPIPAWVREIIDAHLAIEAEDARSAGSLGFIARALVIATMRRRKSPFWRLNTSALGSL